MTEINGKTGILAIIGHPVAHSLSPLMQNAALAACGLDYCFVPFAVHPDALGAAVAGLRALGVAGFNVTIPHKTRIPDYLDRLDESAEAAGAVNVVLNTDGVLTGYNTDGEGLLKSLAEDLGFCCADAEVIVIGAGGAARGAVAALCRAGVKRIIIVNRTKENAMALSKKMSVIYPAVSIIAVTDAEELKPFLSQASLLLNTTSLGMNQEKIPFVKLADLPPDTAIYDMVYAPPVTPLLREATALGLKNANGMGMLAAQGECAFQIWTGATPPAGLMKAVLSKIYAK